MIFPWADDNPWRFQLATKIALSLHIPGDTCCARLHFFNSYYCYRYRYSDFAPGLAIHGLIPGTGQEMFILSKTSTPAVGPI
jgi:hypothetical protein